MTAEGWATPGESGNAQHGCRIGVDTYSYHRLLGEVRAGECLPSRRMRTWAQTLNDARAAGAEVVSVQTCFMSIPDAEHILRTQDSSRIRLAWGHPAGLQFGRSTSAEYEAGEWIRLAASLGHEQMRVVIGHHSVARDLDRQSDIRDTLPALARLAATADRAGITLAIENHTDLTAAQLLWLLEEVDHPRLQVCFDFANALRVGDDVEEAAKLLRGWISMVHVKDITPSPHDGSSGPASTALGAGVLPVGRLVDVLSGNEGVWLLVELGHLGPRDVDEDEMVRQGVAWLFDRVDRTAGRSP